MKKFLTIAVMALSFAGMANAQRAAEYSFGRTAPEITHYNRLGISYNNDAYRNNWHDPEDNFTLNGFGINYTHGFPLSRSLPMFIETGANINFNFGKPWEDSDKEYDYKEYLKMQNINLQIPINYVYRFNITDDFSIAPYLGLNLKLHLITQMKEVYIEDGDREESDWISLFDKDEIGDDTYNRFQMGWHVGATFQYSRVSLGFQYGTDFIPVLKDDMDKINTGSFRMTLGYNF